MLLPLLVAIMAATPAPISTNNMRVPGGKLSNGVLTLQLEARNGLWYPDGPSGMARPVAAFGEVGSGLQVPGPLLRVPVGTDVTVTVKNTLEQPLWMFGLGEKRGVTADSFAIAPGATHTVKFKATEAGVYYYAGKFTPAPLLARGGPDSQLNGMIVVDPPGPTPKDRLFMISWWFDQDTASVSGLSDGSTMAINGLSFPHTEKLTGTEGETATWRWANLTIAPHPLHLHGFYFDVTGTGDGAKFNALASADYQKTVTQFVPPGATMTMAWTPVRAGGWIFHCHFAGHMTSMEGMNKDRRHPGKNVSAGHEGHGYMAGLVMQINVAPNGAMKASTSGGRAIRLLARSKPKGIGEYAGYGYALGGSADEPDVTKYAAPGPLLVLQKNEPVAINIINQTHEPAAVHWHGIELESFPDGVPGVSGYGKTILPAIPAGDSLTVRFVPPRAGTFMYHSHSNEYQQIGSGMYGAIVVLEPGQKLDPETDKLFVFGDEGPTVNLFKGPFPGMVLNGERKPGELNLKAGTTYRFRFINIRAEGGVMVSMKDGEQPLMWKMIARDGADLPANQLKTSPVMWGFASGMIADFEFTPTKTGKFVMKFAEPQVDATSPAGIDLVVNIHE
jgi:manganese oxidase